MILTELIDRITKEMPFLPKDWDAEDIQAFALKYILTNAGDIEEAFAEFSENNVDVSDLGKGESDCIQIKRWILEGHSNLAYCINLAEVLEAAGNIMDRVESHEIVGEVLFEGKDGKYYAGTVEFDVGEAAPEYLTVALCDEARRRLGDTVDVTPGPDDDFKEFTGTLHGIKGKLVTVVDQDDDAFDIDPRQITYEEEDCG